MTTAQKKRRAKVRGVEEGCAGDGGQPLPPLVAAGPHPDPLPHAGEGEHRACPAHPRLLACPHPPSCIPS